MDDRIEIESAVFPSAAEYRLKEGTLLIRITSSDFDHQLFNPIGPLGRFDHHPPLPSKKPAFHPAFGVCYLSQNFKSSLAEFARASFGWHCCSLDADLKNYRVMKIRVRTEIRLLDLFHDGPDLIQAPRSILEENQDPTLSQTWGRTIAHTYPYGGIRWPSPKDGRAAIVLYERVRDFVEVVEILPLTEDLRDRRGENTLLSSSLRLEHERWRMIRLVCPVLRASLHSNSH